MAVNLLNPGCGGDDCYDCPSPTAHCRLVTCNEGDYFNKVMRVSTGNSATTQISTRANSFAFPTIGNHQTAHNVSVFPGGTFDVPLPFGGPYLGLAIPLGEFKSEMVRDGYSNITGHIPTWHSEYFRWYKMELVFKEYAPGDNRWYFHLYDLNEGDSGTYYDPDLSGYPGAPYTPYYTDYTSEPMLPLYGYGSFGSSEEWYPWASSIATSGAAHNGYGSIINCPVNSKAIYWEVPEDATAAWLVRTCPGDIVTNISLDLSNGYEGLAAYDSTCAYSLHATTPAGEVVSNCCNCVVPPTLSFEVSGLTDEFASLNDVYAIDVLDSGTIASGSDSIYCEPSGPTSDIAYSISVTYTSTQAQVTLRLDEEYDGLSFRLDKIYTIDLDPNGLCASGSVRPCDFVYSETSIGTQNPDRCYSAAFSPTFSWS